MITDNWIKEGVPYIIAGPCSAESETQLFGTSQALLDQGIDVIRAGVWKPRTRPNNFEGSGKKALEWMKAIKKELPVKFITEVASAKHVELILQHKIDMVWIGARTTVNPFTVQEIADALQGSDIPVFIKNPINPDLSLWLGAIERMANSGIEKIAAIHRGFSSFHKTQFRNEPLWQIPMELKRRCPNIPLLCDPSHIGGDRTMIFDISKKAIDLNYNGLIIETHLDPDRALSDSAQQITPQHLKDILHQLKAWHSGEEDISLRNKLDELRESIDSIDHDLLETLSARMKVLEEIVAYKNENNIAIFQSDRWNEIMRSRLKWGKLLNLNDKFIEELYELIHAESIKNQTTITNKSIDN